MWDKPDFFLLDAVTDLLLKNAVIFTIDYFVSSCLLHQAPSFSWYFHEAWWMHILCSEIQMHKILLGSLNPKCLQPQRTVKIGSFCSTKCLLFGIEQSCLLCDKKDRATKTWSQTLLFHCYLPWRPLYVYILWRVYFYYSLFICVPAIPLLWCVLRCL